MQDEQIVEPFRATFGEVEAYLAASHMIASDKRSQFRARLRNFQRLERYPIPAGVSGGRGKTVYYGAGQVVELSLALECAQLGLLPERIETIFQLSGHIISKAVRMAAEAILLDGRFPPLPEDHSGALGFGDGPDEGPMSMFLWFDPFVLESLAERPEEGPINDIANATFYCGGQGVLREQLVKMTAGGFFRRLALINVTAMLDDLVSQSEPAEMQRFLQDLVDWAHRREEEELIRDYYDDPESYLQNAAATGFNDEEVEGLREVTDAIRSSSREEALEVIRRVVRKRDGNR